MLDSRAPLIITSLAWMCAASFALPQEASVKPGINERYADPDMNRIEAVLEREDRAIYKYRHAIVAALALEPGMDVADVGAGTGFIARLMAREIGLNGKVYAVEISPQAVDYLRDAASKEGVDNLLPVLGESRSTTLNTGSVDLVLAYDAYHHFEYPEDMLASIRQALRPGGQLAIIEFERVRGVTEDFYFEHVRAGKGTFSDEIKDAGFDLVKEIPLVKGQYFLVFRKR